jgi:hypothetical protein
MNEEAEKKEQEHKECHEVWTKDGKFTTCPLCPNNSPGDTSQ